VGQKKAELKLNHFSPIIEVLLALRIAMENSLAMEKKIRTTAWIWVSSPLPLNY
jgi:hypothetical protein